MLTGNEIRQKFLDYFEQRDHTVVASSSLVPHEDPTLLFTNAGMNQFKDVFLGLDRRDYRRAASSQKCVRAGGKHNDLDTVGKTARHHTFFEMLGNFSFGDYFKKEAIAYAWEFLTVELGIPRESLWVTVFRDDDEAEELWKEHTSVLPDQIVRLGEKDNFWSMGDVGPCGPCSEIIYDRGPEYACSQEPCSIGGCDCDRWLEVWNLVFMQYDRDAQGNMNPLPRPSIDTGMGLERITSVIQKADSNYDTDLIRPLVDYAAALAGISYQPGEEGFGCRVIADHARSCTFLINDGIIPGNEGRGYVLRRILRRAVRFGKALGIHDPFLYRFTDKVAGLMGDAYPEIRENREYISGVIRMEEERFQETLDSGMKVAAEIVERVLSAGGSVIAGEDAFVLYDTYGFPLDLAEDIALENGLEIDREGFTAAMEQQKERARGARSGQGAFQDAAGLAALFGGLAPTVFTGYDEFESAARILMLADERGLPREELGPGETGLVVLDRSPFYGESGGQIGDTGEIRIQGNPVLRVTDTRKAVDGRIYSEVEVLAAVACGSEVNASVTGSRRLDIARNHSATHLLHAALQEVLGKYANQKGSLVEADRLRFDFTHFAPVTPEELEKVEARVNGMILANLPVHSREMALDEARAQGAMALFGEKYGQRVRVVSMGDDSLELCGGTHVERTGSIGLFRIVSEGGIGSGLRRIEAVTGRRAYEMVREVYREREELAGILKTPVGDLMNRASALMDTLKARDEEIGRLKARISRLESADLLDSVQQVEGVSLLSARLEVGDMEALRQAGDMLKDRLKDGVILLGSPAGDKVNFVAMVTGSALDKGAHAGNLIRAVAAIAGGGGGGKPAMAQAGGKDPARLGEALEKAAAILAEQITKARG